MIENHPRYAALMTAINTLITRIRSDQQTFYVGKNRFFQGLRIPITNCDGITDQSIDPLLKPSDVQTETWADFDSQYFKSNLAIPFNISINRYHGPFGDGWYLTVELWYSGLDPDVFGAYGNHWRYVHHEGAEQWYGNLDVWFIIPDVGLL